MLHDPSPQTNGNALTNPNPPSADTIDERFFAELQALYAASEVPQRLKQIGAEQVRLQIAASNRAHAQHSVFGFLNGARTVSSAMKSLSGTRISAQPRNRPGVQSSLDGSPRLTIAAVAAVALISLLAVALFAWPAPFRYGISIGPVPIGGYGKHTPPATVALFGPRIVLTSVAMVSANDGWAFGGESTRPSPNGETPPALRGSTCLVLHYNGTTWSRHPGSACIEATSISMLSATDGWAVGSNTILHYTQGDWRVDTSYALKSMQLESVTMVSSDEGWAVGSSDAPRALVLHYARGHWTPVNVAGMPGDSVSALRGIAMVSAQEGWAVGSELADNGEKTLLLHYVSGQWTRLAWSMTGSFNDVAAFPSGDVWAVGEDSALSGPGLVVHLRQGVPIQEDRPAPSLLQSIAMRSPGEGWAVGGGAATVHYHNGVWTKEGLTIHQFALMRVSLVSATEGWAVGSSLVDGSLDPNAAATLFHLSSGAWQIYPLSGV
ncbi:MAG: WD40/YVTN/BNR-like repeat-containing protein [Ktedonobacterales bacterium]